MSDSTLGYRVSRHCTFGKSNDYILASFEAPKDCDHPYSTCQWFISIHDVFPPVKTGRLDYPVALRVTGYVLCHRPEFHEIKPNQNIILKFKDQKQCDDTIRALQRMGWHPYLTCCRMFTHHVNCSQSEQLNR